MLDDYWSDPRSSYVTRIVTWRWPCFDKCSLFHHNSQLCIYINLVLEMCHSCNYAAYQGFLSLTNADPLTCKAPGGACGRRTSGWYQYPFKDPQWHRCSSGSISLVRAIILRIYLVSDLPSDPRIQPASGTFTLSAPFRAQLAMVQLTHKLRG